MTLKQWIWKVLGLYKSDRTIKGNFCIKDGFDPRGLHVVLKASSNIFSTNYIALVIHPMGITYDIYVEVYHAGNLTLEPILSDVDHDDYVMFSIYPDSDGSKVARVAVGTGVKYQQYPVELGTGWIRKSTNPFIEITANIV